jgi:hypothetical protein
MATNRLTKRDAADVRSRGIITTVLLILLAALIVRDILARRWASPSVTSRSSPGVTYRSSYGSEGRTPPPHDA